MTASGAPARSLAPRLLAAFVAVALIGIAVLAVLVAAGLRAGADQLVAAQRQQEAQQAADSAADAYESAAGWVGADLGGTAALTAAAGASLVVRDERGMIIAAYSSSGLPVQGADSRPGVGPGMGMGIGGGGPPVVKPVESVGVEVGTVALRFPTGGGISSSTLAALWWWIALAAAAALVVAVGVAALVTRRITRPLQRLADAVGRVGSGEREVALMQGDFPGELGDVAEAVTVLASHLDAQERLRRAALADVTHELRTPVAVLQAYLEEMVDGVSPPTTGRLSMLNDEVLRIGRLIGDLETLREAEDAVLSLRPELVDFAGIAAKAADVLAGPAAEQGVHFDRQLARAPLEGDGARLAQVALNLLSNALKHGGSGQVTIRTAADDGRATLEVVDHGPGIPQDELPHIFDRYWRGSSGTRASGSGVGLTVVREIVTAHGGAIEALPTPGGGTTIRVVLPVSVKHG